jgi:hypothetical protein
MQQRPSRIEDLIDAARGDEAASARARERWLARQAEASATLVGSLVDLAEAGAPIAITCVGARTITGTMRAVGTDVVVVAERGGDSVLVRIGAIALVRPAPGGAPVDAARGDRAAALDLTLVELLDRLAGERPDVAVSLDTADVVSGALVAVGADVLTVRLAAGDGGVAYVSASSVSSVRLTRSG